MLAIYYQWLINHTADPELSERSRVNILGESQGVLLVLFLKLSFKFKIKFFL